MVTEFFRKVDIGEDSPVITSPNRKYEVEEIVISGDLADVYKAGDAALKVARDSSNNDLLENEARILTGLLKVKEYESYLPNLIETFVLKDENKQRVNTFSWLSEFFSLEQIHEAYPQGVGFEHGVWMFNRILEFLDFVHSKWIIHGAILPPHAMVFVHADQTHPMIHGIKIIDYTAAVSVKSHIRVVVSKWKPFYPAEVFEKKFATPSTDIYMAVKSIIYVLGGDPKTNHLPDTVPEYLACFLKACVEAPLSQRPKNAWDLHEELAGLMLRNFGPKKYFHFDMPKSA